MSNFELKYENQELHNNSEADMLLNGKFLCRVSCDHNGQVEFQYGNPDCFFWELLSYLVGLHAPSPDLALEMASEAVEEMLEGLREFKL